MRRFMKIPNHRFTFIANYWKIFSFNRFLKNNNIEKKSSSRNRSLKIRKVDFKIIWATMDYFVNLNREAHDLMAQMRHFTFHLGWILGMSVPVLLPQAPFCLDHLPWIPPKVLKFFNFCEESIERSRPREKTGFPLSQMEVGNLPPHQNPHFHWKNQNRSVISDL